MTGSTHYACLITPGSVQKELFLRGGGETLSVEPKLKKSRSSLSGSVSGHFECEASAEGYQVFCFAFLK